jgi:hypothetical protein
MLLLTDSRFGDEMVRIRAGCSDQMRDFFVYEKLIRNSSVFMDNALKEPWKESTERTVCLPDFGSDTFDIYHIWLLTGKIHSRRKWFLSYNISDMVALYGEISQLQKLSHLGHYLIDTAFMDTVCDAILQCCREIESHEARFTITQDLSFYRVLPPGSPTRSMLANVVAQSTSFEKLNNLKPVYGNRPHPDLLMDILHAVAERFLSPRTSISPLQEPENSCKYHSHGEETVCYRKKETGYVTR